MVQDEETTQMLREQAMEYISSAGEETLRKVIDVLEAEESEKDWWDELSPQQQRALEEAVERSERGERGIPHEEAMKIFAEHRERRMGR